jgi:hypothetical protein
MSLQERISAEQGLSIDDAEELDVLPWLETVKDLVAFAASFVSDSEQSFFVGKPTALSGV